MAHLLAINVPVKRDPAWSDWAKMTRAKIKSAGIPVSKWQLLYYHMTILFLDDDAFTATNGAEHIIYLSPTNVPEQILTLAKDARILADGLNADYDKRLFKPHITFGHVPADKMSLEELQAILRTFEQPTFHCIIKEAEHRYRKGNGTIKKWKLR